MAVRHRIPKQTNPRLDGQPRKQNHNIYTAHDRAKAIVCCRAFGVRRTEQLLQIPEQTLSNWHRGYTRVSDEVINLAKHYSEELEKSLSEILETCLPLAVKSAKDAAFRDLMVGIGIATDKIQLLRGEPTQIVEASAVSREEREARIKAILQAAAGRDALPAESENAPEVVDPERSTD